MNTPLILALEVLIFAGVVFGSLMFARRVERLRTVQRRLDSAQVEAKRRPSNILKSFEIKNPFLNWVQSATLDQDEKEKTTLQRDLALAGFPSPVAPAAFVALRFLLAAGLPILFVLAQSFSTHPVVGAPAFLAPMILSAAGLLAPRLLLDQRVTSRRQTLEAEFPDALDLMVVCVEAGLGLEGAILRVGEETRRSHALISHELQMVSFELNAGKSRADALRGLARRTQLDSVNAFVGLLVQSDQLGVSYARTLRTFSNELRDKRFMRAEEKAMRIPLLITLPLMLCILPCVVVAVMLPSIIELTHLMPTLQGAPR